MLISHFARRALLGVQAIAIALSGCDTPCPKQPTTCANSAAVRVKIPDSEAELTAYQLEVVRDDVAPARCLLLLPIPGDWTSRWVATCDGEGAAWAIVAVEPTYEAACSNSLQGSSCAVNRTGQVLAISLPGQPSSVELRLRRGAQSFAPYQASFSYEDVYPDGPSCGNGCQEASLEPSWDELTEPPPE